MSLQINEVTKTYQKYHLSTQKHPALREVSFEAQKGETLALIGQNGAGKTTLLKCILHLLKPDGGSILFDGGPVSRQIDQNQVGYMPEGIAFPSLMTLEDYLCDIIALRGLPPHIFEQAVLPLLKQFELENALKKHLNRFSKGMQKKVLFIQSIFHLPELLILDEPTDGLDPLSRRKLLSLLNERNAEGATVLITSHILSDMEYCSDSIVLLEEGRVRAMQRMADIGESLDDWYIHQAERG